MLFGEGLNVVTDTEVLRYHH